MFCKLFILWNPIFPLLLFERNCAVQKMDLHSYRHQAINCNLYFMIFDTFFDVYVIMQQKFDFII